MEKRTFLKVFTFALTSIVLYPLNGYARNTRSQKNRGSYGYGPYGTIFVAYGNGYGTYGSEFGAYMNGYGDPYGSYGRRNRRRGSDRGTYGYGPYGSRFAAYGNGYGVYGGEYGAYMNGYGRKNGRGLPLDGSPAEEVHRHNNGDVSQ